MSLELLVYLIGIVDDIKLISLLATTLFVFATFLLAVVMFSASVDKKSPVKGVYVVTSIVAMVFTTMVFVLTPNSKALTLMTGVYLAKNVVNSDNEIVQKSFKLLNKKLDEALEGK